MAFEFASTNLVIELGIIIWLLLGWQFTLAEFVGGPIMIAILVVVLRLTLRPRLLEEARVQADRGLVGSMEGHAAMDMSVSGGSLASRIASDRGLNAISHYFVMDWAAIWKDIVLGLLIAGTLAAWVPETFWQSDAKVVEASVSWNYTTFLNIIFLVLSAVLVARVSPNRWARDAAHDEHGSGTWRGT